MKPIFVILLSCNCLNIFCQAKRDSLLLSTSIQATQSQLMTLDTSLTSQLTKAQVEIRRLNAVITAGPQADKIAALNEKIIAIEKIQKLKEDNEKAQRIKKYESGQLAITYMKSGIKIIDFMLILLDLDQTIEVSTNIWGDSNFRNFWNRAEDWGTVAGAVVAVGGFVNSDESTDQMTGLATGAGVIGISKLLGTLFGVNEKKFRERTERIDLSVRAYDDLKMRNEQLKKFLEQNKDFAKRVDDFALEYQTKKDGDISVLLIKLVDLLDDYRDVLKQIPAYLDNISSVSTSYVNQRSKYASLPMEKTFTKINNKCDTVKTKYQNDVKPLLDISPELKKLIMN